MKSVSKEVRKKTVTFTLPEVIYDRAVSAAQSGGQSLAAWLRFAVMTYARKWEFPAGDTEAAALTCEHPACHRPASRCKRPTEHKAQGMWT